MKISIGKNKFFLNRNLLIVLISISFIMVGFISFLAYHQKQTNKQMKKVNEQLSILEKEKIEMVDTKEKIKEDFKILRSIAKKSIPLKATEKNNSALAIVHWDAKIQSTFVDIMNLNTPPDNRQYQLWAIVDGQAINAGLINSRDKEGLLQEAIFIPNPQAFVITLEPLGGNSKPTYDRMVVIGYV